MMSVDCCVISDSIVISVSKLTSVTCVMVVTLRTSMTYAMLCPLRTLVTYAMLCPLRTSVTCADSVKLAFSYLLFFFRFCLFFFCYSTFKRRQVFHVCPSLHKAWSYVSCIVVCRSLSQMTCSYCYCCQHAFSMLLPLFVQHLRCAGRLMDLASAKSCQL